MAKTGPKPRPWQERIMRYVIPEPNTGCWLWEGARTGQGYGHMGLGGIHGGSAQAHRLMWELTNGPIPDGLWVLHRCDVRLCCNPGHLFLGTPLDNMRDMHAKGRGRISAGPAAIAARTHCKNGHLFDEANTYYRKDRNGHRCCRICNVNRGRQRRFT